MKSSKLLTVLESVLGSHEKTSKTNVLFYCPFCNHYKRKLVVQLDTTLKGENEWHCWVCNVKGRKLYNLFKTLNVSSNQMQELITCLGLTVGDINNLFNNTYESDNTLLELPKQFHPFISPKNTPWYRSALNYLRSERNLSNYDIIKYHLGYCEEGQFKNKIIIPSYDYHGNLNYFVSRDFTGSESKFKNPDYSKNIVPFELYINWNLPIILVEGAFDAMTVKRNCIPLFGKVIQEELKIKIITNKVKQIYICLDKDAFKNALDVCDEFMRLGITVYFVNLNDKDPNVMGFAEVMKVIKNTNPLTFSDLIKFKLSI